MYTHNINSNAHTWSRNYMREAQVYAAKLRKLLGDEAARKVAAQVASRSNNDRELADGLKAALVDAELPYEAKIAKIAAELQEKYHLEEKRVTRAIDIILWGSVTVENKSYPKTYQVLSFKQEEEYLVNIDERTCECGDFVGRKAICKHRIAAGIVDEYHRQYPSTNGNRNQYTDKNGKSVEW